MQQVNIITMSSPVNASGQTAKNMSGNSTDGTFNALLHKEISGNQAASNTPAPSPVNQVAENASAEESNDASQKADTTASPTTRISSSTDQPEVKKKAKADQDDDKSSDGIQKDSKPDQLIQFFGALSALPKADQYTAVADKNQTDTNADASLSVSTGLSTQSSDAATLQPATTQQPDLATLQASSPQKSDVVTTDLKKISGTDHLPREFTTSDAGIEGIKGKKEIGKKDFITPSDVSKTITTAADAKLQKTETRGEPATAIPATKDTVKSSDSTGNFIDHLILKQSEEKLNTTVPSPYLQQANVIQTATMTGVVSSNQITPNLNSPMWDKAIGQKVIWMVGESMQSAELTLNPPDLGPLQIVLNVTNDQANATFVSAHPDVRDALEASLPKLRQMMNDAGVQLSNFSVQSGAAHQDQAGREYRSQSSHQSAGARHSNTPAIDNDVAIQATAVRMITRIGEVDTFA